MKVIVSCIGKFHAFSLAEQLQMHSLLHGFYTSYAWQKNNVMRRFARRVDNESIDKNIIHTNIPLAILIKSFHQEFLWIELFDHWVAKRISILNDYDVFIGWSGMSLHSIRVAKQQGKITILERGSSHIEYQNTILKEEYGRYGIKFSIDKRVIEKELLEYELSDYISIPSNFVKNTFLEKGIPEKKLILNAYGASHIFKNSTNPLVKKKFRVLYLGGLTRQKGLIYLFIALSNLNISPDFLEIWFIGGISDEMNAEIEKHKRDNWTFWGHVQQQELPNLISQCDVAIQPSLQEGLSMVIPQILSCGVPVIATTNTGGEDVIEEGETGFIIPIRSPEAIAQKIQHLYDSPDILARMKDKAAKSASVKLSWEGYGNRYVQFLQQVVKKS